MRKKKDKNPYINFTLEEVAHAEERHYYVQVDQEVANAYGRYTHSKDTAENIFWSLLDSIQHMKESGNKAERIDAEKCLLNLRIHKLRIH